MRLRFWKKPKVSDSSMRCANCDRSVRIDDEEEGTTHFEPSMFLPFCGGLICVDCIASPPEGTWL